MSSRDQRFKRDDEATVLPLIPKDSHIYNCSVKILQAKSSHLKKKKTHAREFHVRGKKFPDFAYVQLVM